MWGGPGLGLWPPWNLGPAPIFQPDFPAKYESQKDFVDFMGTLPFPAKSPYSQAMKELPCSPLGHMLRSKWPTGSSQYPLGPFAPHLCSRFPAPPTPRVENIDLALSVLIKPKTPSPGLSDPAATQTVPRAGTQK